MAIVIKDAYKLINMIAEQATGQRQITPVDTRGFVSLGSKVIETGTDNVIKALSVVMGRLFVAVRPYDEKLKLLNEVDTGSFTARMRKISYYNDGVQASGMYNTDINANNLKQGSENVSSASAVGSMWEQNYPTALELNFYSSDVWDTSMTVTEDQLKSAFRDEEEFLKFWNGVRVQKQNEIALANESFRRMQLINSLASRYIGSKNSSKLVSTAVNMTKAFNDKYGTQYKSKELRTTHLKEFLPFMVSTIKQYSRKMATYGALYHNPVPSGSKMILRHTPRDRQNLMLYNPLIIDAEAMVLPEIFNDNYLIVDNYESIDYWQVFTGDSEKDGLINVNCNYMSDTATIVSGSATDVFILGYLYDKDALLTNIQNDSTYATPVEARKGYRNIWWHFKRGAIDDNTENGIVFYMEDTVLPSHSDPVDSEFSVESDVDTKKVKGKK